MLFYQIVLLFAFVVKGCVTRESCARKAPPHTDTPKLAQLSRVLTENPKNNILRISFNQIIHLSIQSIIQIHLKVIFKAIVRLFAFVLIFVRLRDRYGKIPLCY